VQVSHSPDDGSQRVNFCKINGCKQWTSENQENVPNSESDRINVMGKNNTGTRPFHTLGLESVSTGMDYWTGWTFINTWPIKTGYSLTIWLIASSGLYWHMHTLEISGDKGHRASASVAIANQ